MTSPVVSECCHARTGASIELGAPPVAPLLCCALRWPHLCLGTSVILVGMAKDGMKRLAATARGGRSPTVVHAVVCRKRWRPAMEHLGIDVHKVESQICILTEGGKVVERRIRTQRERFAAVLGEAAGEGPDRGVDGERVGGSLPGRAGPRGGGGGPELRRHVRDAEPQGENRPARRAHAG